MGDHLWDFRQRLLWRLSMMQVESLPTDPAVTAGSTETLYIRDAQENVDPEEPYRVGQTTIAGAGPWIQHRRLAPDHCPGAPGRRTFVLGGSAAFGYPYRFPQSFAALADTRSGKDGGRVLNAAHVGSSSDDLVPVARTILDHYDASTLIIFSGNNEWFHWHPRPVTSSSNSPEATPLGASSRATLQFLAHSRALAGIEFVLLDSLHGQQRRSAPLPVMHDDGFTAHFALTGCQHALEHPLASDRFKASQWPDTRQRYLDRFEANLTTIVRAAHEQDVRVILLTIPFHYRLSPAWKHPQPAWFATDHREQMQQLTTRAMELKESGDATLALEVIRQAVALDPLPAVPHYLEAQLLESLERPAEAEASYARSREAMIGNLGSCLSINRVIRKVAAEHETVLVDVRQLFDNYEHERQRYFNVDLVHDDCHPTPLGHELIAQALRPHLQRPASDTP